MLVRPVVFRVAFVSVLLGMTACAVDEGPVPSTDVRNPDTGPNAGMFRDFIDGKFDSAGHPLNAVVVDINNPDCHTCAFEVPANARGYGLLANLHLRVHEVQTPGVVASIQVTDDGGTQITSRELTTTNLRETGRWIDLPIDLLYGTRVELIVASGARVELAYAEIFPAQFGLVTDPGSGVLADSDLLAFEVPRSGVVRSLTADGISLEARLDSLILTGRATRTTTELRTLYEVAVGDLLPTRGDVVDLRVTANHDANRLQIRMAGPACSYEGDPTGVPVLVTGFQPFPANAGHENVAGVAVTALDASSLRDARVMKLILPVEYDRAAAIVSDVIERCQPVHVLSFGQGGSGIALEQTAYNLQDTGELAGGVPDNRGIIRSATPILEDGPAERATLLPLDDIRDALDAIGETAEMSTDPGRYICNNVMYTNLSSAVSGRTGFIHLPYTTNFTDRARWGRIIGAAVQATVDAD